MAEGEPLSQREAAFAEDRHIGVDEAVPQSLTEDLGALYDDVKTYVESEKRFQKSRLRFSAGRAKYGLLFALGALGFLHLALIALVVGLVIALTPLVTAWGAMAIVFVLLLVGGLLLARMAMRKFKQLSAAFRSQP